MAQIISKICPDLLSLFDIKIKAALIFQSTEAYEGLTSRFELYSQIKEGMDDIATGNPIPFSEVMAYIRSRRSR